MKVLIYDVEIVRAIPPKRGKGAERTPGIEYCNGWHDFANMGIACVGTGVYDWSHDRGLRLIYFSVGIGVAFAQKIVEWVNDHKAQGDPVVTVGFNSYRFDDRLMAANGINLRSDYDLLREIYRAQHGQSSYLAVPGRQRYGLDFVAKANGLSGKPEDMDGAAAPVLWQAGERSRVMTYCVGDIRDTGELLARGLKGGLIDPNTHKSIPALRPLGNYREDYEACQTTELARNARG